MRRCAVELTGRNSVSPSTTPSKIDNKKSFIIFATSLKPGTSLLIPPIVCNDLTNHASMFHSDGFRSPFVRPDTNGLFHFRHENFSVADLTSLGRPENCFHNRLSPIVR